MALEKQSVFAAFFDEGEYTSLFGQGALEAAWGCAGGQPVYAVFQGGEAVTASDLEKNCKVLDLAAKTGSPVVTFYNCPGGKVEEGLALLKANAALTAKLGEVSGVVPQLAVVLGVCGGTAALQAAGADLCIMAADAELFFTAPFTSAAAGDKVEGAGSAALAAKAGVAAIVEDTWEAAVAKAARLAGMLPSNNLAGPVLTAGGEPAAWPAKYDAEKAVAALADGDTVVELFPGLGKNIYVALGAVNGVVTGFVATRPGELCHNCSNKAARFVRFCDAFGIPVVTVVNSHRFVSRISDEVIGGLRGAARLAATYADATTARVAVLAGEACGPVYTALATADMTIAMPGSVTAVLDPHAAVTVLHKDELDSADNLQAATDKLAAAYTAEAGPEAAVLAGCADVVADAAGIRAAVVSALDILSSKRAQRLPKKHGNMAL